jgi:hypothetical protein
MIALLDALLFERPLGSHNSTVKNFSLGSQKFSLGSHSSQKPEESRQTVEILNELVQVKTTISTGND